MSVLVNGSRRISLPFAINAVLRATIILIVRTMDVISYLYSARHVQNNTPVVVLPNVVRYYRYQRKSSEKSERE
jgi:hypothetical protein